MPQVSICIPTYSQAHLLIHLLHSIMEQTYQDFEVIITDDTPDDSVEKAIQTFSVYSDFYPKIKYFKNAIRLGSPENWNECIRQASGEYLKFIHHDDFLSYKDSLERFVKMLDDNPQADFAFSASNLVNAQQEFIRVHELDAQFCEQLQQDPSILIKGNLIGAPSATITRRRANLLFDPKLKWVVDIEFYLRILHQTPHFVFELAPLISVMIETEHAVTHECQNDKNINLYEWIYLYKRVQKLKLNKPEYLNHILRLCKQYQIVSSRELYKIGIDYPLPLDLQFKLALNQLNKAVEILKIIKKNDIEHFQLFNSMNCGIPHSYKPIVQTIIICRNSLKFYKKLTRSVKKRVLTSSKI